MDSGQPLRAPRGSSSGMTRGRWPAPGLPPLSHGVPPHLRHQLWSVWATAGWQPRDLPHRRHSGAAQRNRNPARRRPKAGHDPRAFPPRLPLWIPGSAARPRNDVARGVAAGRRRLRPKGCMPSPRLRHPGAASERSEGRRIQDPCLAVSAGRTDAGQSAGRHPFFIIPLAAGILGSARWPSACSVPGRRRAGEARMSPPAAAVARALRPAAIPPRPSRRAASPAVAPRLRRRDR